MDINEFINEQIEEQKEREFVSALMKIVGLIFLLILFIAAMGTWVAAQWK